jgi:hypothetical protein
MSATPSSNERTSKGSKRSTRTKAEKKNIEGPGGYEKAQ